MGIHSSHRLGVVWISISHEICKKTHTLEIYVFSQNFPVVWEFNFSMFWKLHGSLLHAKYLTNPYFLMFVFSHTFRVLWELTFPMV